MDKELEDLIEESKRKVAAMTPAERDAMIKEQAESWVRAEQGAVEWSSSTPVTDWSESADVGQFTVTRTYPDGGDLTAVEFVLNIRRLADKARKLVEMLDDAEVNHGGLVGGVTLRAKNDLRLELSKWK